MSLNSNAPSLVDKLYDTINSLRIQKDANFQAFCRSEAEIQQLTRHIKHLAENAASADQELDRLKELQAKTIQDIRNLPFIQVGTDQNLLDRNAVIYILLRLTATNHP